MHRLTELDAAHQRGFLKTEPGGATPAESSQKTGQTDLIGRVVLTAAGALAFLLTAAVILDI